MPLFWTIVIGLVIIVVIAERVAADRRGED
jgi:hypothetical protein